MAGLRHDRDLSAADGKADDPRRAARHDRLDGELGASDSREVEAHLASHLDQLPPQDAKSRAIVEQMRVDEVAHGAAAQALGAVETPPPAKAAMTVMGKIMTSTAYYI